MYKITLEDGNVIDNLILNGNNYISEEEIDDSGIQGILNEVVIENENQRVVYGKLKLISHIKADGKSWLVFAEPTIEELKMLRIEQDQKAIIEALANISK